MNVLTGNAGNDVLSGLGGNDKLVGGLGSDTFVFNAAISTTTNRDAITDFANASGDNDICHLENAIFTKLGAGAAHALNPAFFKVGAAATDAHDFLVYNKTTGVLSCDVNGSGAGGVTQICALTNKLTLTATDFFVI